MFGGQSFGCFDQNPDTDVGKGIFDHLLYLMARLGGSVQPKISKKMLRNQYDQELVISILPNNNESIIVIIISVYIYISIIMNV